MCHLTGGVHSRIRSPRHRKDHPTCRNMQNLRQCGLQFTLYRTQSRLTCPAVESATQIGDI